MSTVSQRADQRNQTSLAMYSPVDRERQRDNQSTRPTIPSVVISVYLIVLCLVILTIQYSVLNHWFLAPVALCGIIVGIDAVDWFRGRLDVFDLAGMFGVFGVYFFFVAPLLHVIRDYYLPGVPPPPDWRDWLGYMAILNVAGLLAYKLGRRLIAVRDEPGETAVFWRLDYKRFSHVITGAMVVTAGVQLGVYWLFGGLRGFINASAIENRREAFQGFGIVFAVSESFPILATLAFVMYLKHHDIRPSWRLLGIALFGLFILLLLFGGLRGTRVTIIWSMFWAIGLIHFLIRPIPRKLVVAGLVGLVLFTYLYGFYKGAGTEGIPAIYNAEQRAILERETRRDLNLTLLGDFGRSDIQAYVLYQMMSANSGYEPAWGRTYIGALAYTLPRQFFPARPPTKVKESTNILYGQGAWESGRISSVRVYGLAGETMLNFGPLAVPFAFGLLGLLVSVVSRFQKRLHPADARWLLMPFIINGVFTILFNDSDVIFAFFILNGALPFVAVFISVTRERLRRRSPQRNWPADALANAH